MSAFDDLARKLDSINAKLDHMNERLDKDSGWGDQTNHVWFWMFVIPAAVMLGCAILATTV